MCGPIMGGEKGVAEQREAGWSDLGMRIRTRTGEREGMYLTVRAMHLCEHKTFAYEDILVVKEAATTDKAVRWRPSKSYAPPLTCRYFDRARLSFPFVVLSIASGFSIERTQS